MTMTRLRRLPPHHPQLRLRILSPQIPSPCCPRMHLGRHRILHRSHPSRQIQRPLLERHYLRTHRHHRLLHPAQPQISLIWCTVLCGFLNLYSMLPLYWHEHLLAWNESSAGWQASCESVYSAHLHESWWNHLWTNL